MVPASQPLVQALEHLSQPDRRHLCAGNRARAFHHARRLLHDSQRQLAQRRSNPADPEDCPVSAQAARH